MFSNNFTFYLEKKVFENGHAIIHTLRCLSLSSQFMHIGSSCNVQVIKVSSLNDKQFFVSDKCTLAAFIKVFVLNDAPEFFQSSRCFSEQYEMFYNPEYQGPR